MKKRKRKEVRKLRGGTLSRLAVSRGIKVDLYSIPKDRHVSDLTCWPCGWLELVCKDPQVLSDPSTKFGIYVEGPILKGRMKSGRFFIDLGSDDAWEVTGRSPSLKLVKRSKLEVSHLNPAIIKPLIEKAKHALSEYLDLR